MQQIFFAYREFIMQISDKGPNLIDSSEIISKKIFVAIKESGKTKDEISKFVGVNPETTGNLTPQTHTPTEYTYSGHIFRQICQSAEKLHRGFYGVFYSMSLQNEFYLILETLI